jgi:uncharacterized membrane protein YvbJ
MKCEKCGHDNPPKTLYCISCGQKIIYTKQKVKEEYEALIRNEKIKKGIELTQLMLTWALVIFFILLAVRAPFTKAPKVYAFPALKQNFYQKIDIKDTLDINDLKQ